MPIRKPSARALDGLSLTSGQAHYVLNALLREGRVKAREVRVHLDGLAREIDGVEAQLNILRAASSISSRSKPSTNGKTGAPVRRRHLNLSAERRAALKLQGHYLALMRQVPKSKRAGFTAMFKKNGAEAAISALRKLLGK